MARNVDGERATSFSDDSAFPVEQGDTKSQMEPSESEEKDGGSERHTMGAGKGKVLY